MNLQVAKQKVVPMPKVFLVQWCFCCVLAGTSCLCYNSIVAVVGVPIVGIATVWCVFPLPCLVHCQVRKSIPNELTGFGAGHGT